MSELIALRINCPLCNESLLDSKCLVDNLPGVRLEIITTDEKGIIHVPKGFKYLSQRFSPFRIQW